MHPSSTAAPLVSILMPVYNGERYLRAAIDSMLAQTQTDFELIAIDDASSDGSAAILASYADARLRVLTQEVNTGIVGALNNGLACARGRYIARMDADDISYAQRLEKQTVFMEAHPEIGLLGSWIRGFGDVRRKYVHRYPQQHDDIRALMLFENPFAHSTVMFRRALLIEHGLQYSERFKYVEDWALWWQLSSVSRVANLPEVLVDYRINKAGSSYTGTSIQTTSRLRFVEERLAEAGLPYHPALAEMAPASLDELRTLSRAFDALPPANAASGYMDAAALQACIGRLWFRSCYRSRRQGLAVARLYFSNPHAPMSRPQRFLRGLSIVFRSYARHMLDCARNMTTGRAGRIS
ncbi:glycosyltransferase [Herbaspirillum sp. LeCh32-8]|uniref:glycosyltransferase n=1 Tax=Herbaspirillum sp. LeCh32-8 TaxID=2821356 RepID=UPI001AE6E57D|nr:glycosyltransferase [Herbaspirillum sp. LeCh32-8]MBP0598386.1 glycosyltransferase [Herbaspirillum sp. LeCh32-8]